MRNTPPRRRPERPLGELSPRLPTGETARKIVALFRADPRRLWTPRQVAKELRLSKGTVRKELRRILVTGDDRPAPLVVLDRGIYRAFVDASDLSVVEAPPPQFHALQVACTLPQNRGWGVSGSAPRSYGSLVVTRPDWTFNKQNGQWFRDTQWEGRLVTIAVTPSSGTVQVSLRASGEAVPVQRFDEFLAWTHATLQAFNVFWSDRVADVDVHNIEFNWDYKRLYVSGPNRLSLRKFRNSLVQLYQKAQRMRVELRVQSVRDERLTGAEVAAIISTLTTKIQPEAEAPYAPPPDDLGPEVA